MHLLHPGERNYPELLGAIPSPPPLYVRGTITADDALAVAIVGSRAATPYGVEVAERLAAELAARGMTIVDRKSTRLNSSHSQISYAVFCLKKKKKTKNEQYQQ